LKKATIAAIFGHQQADVSRTEEEPMVKERIGSLAWLGCHGVASSFLVFCPHEKAATPVLHPGASPFDRAISESE